MSAYRPSHTVTPRPALIKARKARGLSHTEFGQLIGICRTHVIAIEVGRQDPSYAVLMRWSEALGLGLNAWRPRKKPAARPRPRSVAAAEVAEDKTEPEFAF